MIGCNAEWHVTTSFLDMNSRRFLSYKSERRLVTNLGLAKVKYCLGGIFALVHLLRDVLENQ